MPLNYYYRKHSNWKVSWNNQLIAHLINFISFWENGKGKFPTRIHKHIALTMMLHTPQLLALIFYRITDPKPLCNRRQWCPSLYPLTQPLSLSAPAMGSFYASMHTASFPSPWWHLFGAYLRTFFSQRELTQPTGGIYVYVLLILPLSRASFQQWGHLSADKSSSIPIPQWNNC